MEITSKVRLLAAGLTVLVCLVSTNSPAAAVDYFLKIDGIDGESTDDKHRNSIDVNSFTGGLGAALGSHAGGGGGGAGKVSMNDFHFRTAASKATPILMQYTASGQHIPEAKLTCRKAGGEQQEFLVITLKDVIISSYSLGGTSVEEDVVPMEEFSLNFSKVEFEYTTKDERGQDTVVKAGYDLKLNKKI
jgi:type VI secretion system secreted protein Hcp